VEIRFTAVHEEEGENQYKPLDVNNEDVSWAYRWGDEFTHKQSE